MMHFLIIGTDGPDSAASRQALRPAHVAYWQSLGAGLKLGGPLLDSAGAGASPTASVLLIEAETQAQAEAIARADPFSNAVFVSLTVTPMRLTLGAWPQL